MRRVPATLLLCLFSFSLIGPAVFAETESQLPECCRRSGKHHCSETPASSQEPSSGSEVKTAPQKCPYFPFVLAGPSDGKAALGIGFWTVFASEASQSAGDVQTEARYRFSFSRSRQKRGPPALLS